MGIPKEQEDELVGTTAPDLSPTDHWKSRSDEDSDLLKFEVVRVISDIFYLARTESASCPLLADDPLFTFSFSEGDKTMFSESNDPTWERTLRVEVGLAMVAGGCPRFLDRRLII